MTGTIELRADFARFAEKLRSDIPLVMRYIAIGLRDMIVVANPVDTGYSRSQWRMSVDEIDTTVDPPPARGSGRIAAPKANLGDIVDVKPGSSIYIANSVYYVQYLEDGTSQQAPNGMVRISVDRVAGQIDEYVNRLTL